MMKQLHRKIASWVGFFLLAALLTGCAKESSVVDSPEVKQPTQPTQPAQTPIALSAYTAQPIATTRADSSLLADHGIPDSTSIGVYAYYHPGSGNTPGAWSNESSKPDFMFNQQAIKIKSEDGFSYSPLKYWPNTNQDKLSFIGYYPYTTTFDDSSEDPNGIALLKGSDEAGLPTFEFLVNGDVTKQVDFLISDLLTGLPNGTSAVSPSSATYRDAESGYLTIVDKVRLLFHHATSKVTIRIAVDDDIREDFISMTIDSLKLTNIYRKGTVTPEYDSDTGITTIKMTGEPSDSLTYKIVAPGENPGDPVVSHLTDTYLLLPQTLAYVANDTIHTAKINISYSITLRSHGTVYTYDNNGKPVETDRYTYSNTASLPLAKMKRANSETEIDKWLPNHHYIYTLRLGANRIEFTGQVVEWGQEVEWEGYVKDI